ncbi:MAG TPA: MEDS domain-containing protein [Vicinamibacterales bacterium]|nr:MEDS domain-containing protein [Vicinamibacterales bacterium]
MTAAPTPMSLAGSVVHETRHVCAFFNDADEEYRVLLPFIAEGFVRGDRAIHVVEADRSRDHLERLALSGIDTAGAAARGQLDVRSTAEVYLRAGRFDIDRMLATFERLASGNRDHPYPRSRIVCRMDWAAASQSLIDAVIEFESQVNDLWRAHDDVVICTYRMDQLGGGSVIDILRTHPAVIIGGLLQRNPFFVPPQTFLPELRRRRAAAHTGGPEGAV